MELQLIDHNSDRNKQIDELEKVMLTEFEPIECPVDHIFTPGLYTRQIFMPAGSFITSKIHKTEHPYVVSQGLVSVWIDEGEEIVIDAPFTGITKPGTRRVLYVWEDTIWTTFHANPDNENLEQIEQRIIEKHENPLLTEQLKNKMISLKHKLET